MADIEKLRAEVKRLEKELGEANTALFDALVEAGGFKAGEVVEAKKRYGHMTEFRPAIIRRVTIGWFGERCHYVCSFAKKDGDWSKVEVPDCEVRKPTK